MSYGVYTKSAGAAFRKRGRVKEEKTSGTSQHQIVQVKKVVKCQNKHGQKFNALAEKSNNTP